jgi:hypothetical protein
MNWKALREPGNLISWLALQAWCFCEYFQIPLGSWGPRLFGLMVGRSGKEISKK